MAQTQDEVLLTPGDLAERWQVPPSRLANWRYRGEGPAYTKVGGSVRYALSNVVTYEMSMLKEGSNRTSTSVERSRERRANSS